MTFQGKVKGHINPDRDCLPENYYDTQQMKVTVRSRGPDPLYVLSYYIKWVKTSWIYGRNMGKLSIGAMQLERKGKKQTKTP